MNVAIQVLGLGLQVAQVVIRLLLEVLVLAGKLAAWIFREVIVPGVHATGAGLMNLAGLAADRWAAYRANRQALEQGGWTSADDEAARALLDRGDER